MMWWVITSTEETFGPYDREEDAFFFGSMNLEPGTWTISHTNL